MEQIKYSQVIPLLNAITHLDKVKLSGQILKVIVKNKKILAKAYEDIEDVRKRIVETYMGEDNKVTQEGETEWNTFNLQEIDVKLEKFNSGLLDQYSDLTLEQYEILDLMSE